MQEGQALAVPSWVLHSCRRLFAMWESGELGKRPESNRTHQLLISYHLGEVPQYFGRQRWPNWTDVSLIGKVSSVPVNSLRHADPVALTAPMMPPDDCRIGDRGDHDHCRRQARQDKQANNLGRGAIRNQQIRPWPCRWRCRKTAGRQSKQKGKSQPHNYESSSASNGRRCHRVCLPKRYRYSLLVASNGRGEESGTGSIRYIAFWPIRETEIRENSDWLQGDRKCVGRKALIQRVNPRGQQPV